MVSARTCSSARVVITGAADGIGRACALAFAELGAELLLCDYDAPGLHHIARQTGALARFCDIASEASVDIFAADILDSFERLDILINAAGSAYIRSLGMMRMSRALFPGLRKGPGGKLIANIAPRRRLRAVDGLFPNAGSEAAFGRLSESIALQTRGTAIRTATIIEARPSSNVHEFSAGESSEAILISLNRLEPAQAAARIACLACEFVTGLDCGPQQVRRACG